MSFNHIPVLRDEVLKVLNIQSDGVYIDCTAGGGGHLCEIASQCSNGRVIGIDQDDDAIRHLNSIKPKNVEIIKGNFKDIKKIAEKSGIKKVLGILADLGVSTHQLKTPGRGFSFNEPGPLDMRMDNSCGITAETVVNQWEESEIRALLFEYGEERNAAKIAGRICKIRSEQKITTTLQLADIVEGCFPAAWRRKNKIHPATRTFQALRITVNSELEILEQALNDMIELLAPGGRIAVISFHSLEDRIVKTVFKSKTLNCICPPQAIICTCNTKKSLNIVTKKPILPSDEELHLNPASRSAKLRAAEKI